jgi:hypothetical protein
MMNTAAFMLAILGLAAAILLLHIAGERLHWRSLLIASQLLLWVLVVPLIIFAGIVNACIGFFATLFGDTGRMLRDFNDCWVDNIKRKK